MKNKILTTIFLSGAILFSSCRQQVQTETPLRSVCVTTPIALSSSAQAHYSGVVREASELSLGFKTSGQIATVNVKEGQLVQKGQLIATLDDTDYRLGISALEIQYEQFAAETKRLEALYESKSVTKNDYEKMASALAQLEVQLKLNKKKLEYCKLTAPTTGYVQTVNFAASEMVDAGTPVITLLDVSRMEVLCDIPLSDYAQRESFTSFTCQGTDGRTWNMQLLGYIPKADGNQLYRMRLGFPTTAKGITAGMNMNVTASRNISTDGKPTGVTIPMSSVMKTPNGECVWTVQPDSTLRRTPVTTAGMDDNGQCIISAGLVGNEVIVRAGASTLQEGEKIRVVETPAASNVGGLL